jgi:hypothetical protein
VNLLTGSEFLRGENQQQDSSLWRTPLAGRLEPKVGSRIECGDEEVRKETVIPGGSQYAGSEKRGQWFAASWSIRAAALLPRTVAESIRAGRARPADRRYFGAIECRPATASGHFYCADLLL